MKPFDFILRLPRHRRRRAARVRARLGAQGQGFVLGFFVGATLVLGVVLELKFWGFYAN